MDFTALATARGVPYPYHVSCSAHPIALWSTDNLIPPLPLIVYPFRSQNRWMLPHFTRGWLIQKQAPSLSPRVSFCEMFRSANTSATHHELFCMQPRKSPLAGDRLSPASFARSLAPLATARQQKSRILLGLGPVITPHKDGYGRAQQKRPARFVHGLVHQAALRTRRAWDTRPTCTKLDKKCSAWENIRRYIA